MTAATDRYSAVGRGELCDAIDDLSKRLRAVETERNAYLANLTSTQSRCTELLLANRAIPDIAPLLEALTVGRAKHPEGANLTALAEEVGEVARAMRRETPERVREELLDVAVVAMRLYLGEWFDGGAS